MTPLPTPRLCVELQQAQRSFSLAEGSFWTIGRSLANNIVLPDRCVSRKHAMLQMTDQDAFYLIDLGSRNGSFINGRRITLPVRLQHGDRLVIGHTRLEFQQPGANVIVPVSTPATAPTIEVAWNNHSAASPPPLPVEQTTTILMFQPDRQQGTIWHRLLKTLGMEVDWAKEDKDVSHVINYLEAQIRLPALLLVDIEALQPNPFVFCRWCREEHPGLKVILTNNLRNEIYPTERRWATQQGALDLLAGFPARDLLADSIEILRKLNVVLEALSRPTIQTQSMFLTLQKLQVELEQASSNL